MKAADEGPHGNESRLEEACRSTSRLMRATFDTSTPTTVSKASLESINRRETGAESNDRPFYAGQQVDAVRQYTDSWVQILRLIVANGGGVGKTPISVHESPRAATWEVAKCHPDGPSGIARHVIARQQSPQDDRNRRRGSAVEP